MSIWTILAVGSPHFTTKTRAYSEFPFMAKDPPAIYLKFLRFGHFLWLKIPSESRPNLKNFISEKKLFRSLQAIFFFCFIYIKKK